MTWFCDSSAMLHLLLLDNRRGGTREPTPRSRRSQCWCACSCSGCRACWTWRWASPSSGAAAPACAASPARAHAPTRSAASSTPRPRRRPPAPCLGRSGGRRWCRCRTPRRTSSGAKPPAPGRTARSPCSSPEATASFLKVSSSYIQQWS